MSGFLVKLMGLYSFLSSDYFFSMKYNLKMLTSEDILSQRGKTLKRIDNNLYRFGWKIRSGDVWRCIRKMCKAKVLIKGESIIPEGIEHNHSKSYKLLKDENSNEKKFDNSFQSYYIETSDDDDVDNDDELNGL